MLDSRILVGAIALALPLSVGCAPACDCEDTEPQPEVPECADAADGCGWPGGPILTAAWAESALTIGVSGGGATGFSLGIAETGAGDIGWYSEDCLTAACHTFSGTAGTLSSVADLEDVVLGSTTLFDGDQDGRGDAYSQNGGDRLTYLVRVTGGTQDGDCFVWGDQPDYYEDMECSSL